MANAIIDGTRSPIDHIAVDPVRRLDANGLASASTTAHAKPASPGPGHTAKADLRANIDRLRALPGADKP